jgi:thiol peroxidase
MQPQPVKTARLSGRGCTVRQQLASNDGAGVSMKICHGSRIKGLALLTVGIILLATGCKKSDYRKERDMAERTGLVTMKGNPITLIGKEVKVGQKAPDAELVANDLSVVKLSSVRQGKVCIITAVPSLDTPVCDLETRRFNTEAGNLGDDIVVVTISMDLPFAQTRWCGAAGVRNVQTLSDHRDAAFGKAYGVLIKDLRLLARTVFVVDKQGVVRYVELVKEIASEPNYQAALDAARELL